MPKTLCGSRERALLEQDADPTLKNTDVSVSSSLSLQAGFLLAVHLAEPPELGEHTTAGPDSRLSLQSWRSTSQDGADAGLFVTSDAPDPNAKEPFKATCKRLLDIKKNFKVVV
ncbi:UNVERIFIED_CONTAM: hypothetical protein FKN15_037952 [Acipenser sinensis]